MRPGKHLAAFFFILLSFSATYACSCLPSRPPCNYYGTADAIFLGRVIGSTEPHAAIDADGNEKAFDVGTVKFLVAENYKGAPGPEVEVYSGATSSCGYRFVRNESYVVYAYRSTSGALSTTICSRTRLVSAAAEDLEYFRGLAKAKAGGTLYGNLMRFIRDPAEGSVEEGPKMSGVKIVVTGEGRTIETMTNANGEYRLTGLPPGDYDAYPELPSTLGFTSNRDKNKSRDFGRFEGREPVPLVDRGCGELSFTVEFNGSVSGKVVDAEGKPVKEVEVNLMSGDNSEKNWFTSTDREGRYEFRMVQPGRYLLGFNLKWSPDKDDPYPKTYYPGVKTRSETTLLTIGEGVQLKGYDLTLPPKLTEREVMVTVVWPDGRTVVNVEVFYEISEGLSLGERVKTDKQGRAVLRLFEDYRYLIYGRAERDDNDVHSAPVEIVVNADLAPLRVVLDKPGYGSSAKDALKRKSPQ